MSDRPRDDRPGPDRPDRGRGADREGGQVPLGGGPAEAAFPATDRSGAPLYLARYRQRSSRPRPVPDQVDDEDTSIPLYLRRFRAKRSGAGQPEPERSEPPVLEEDGQRFTEAWAGSTKQKEIIPPPGARDGTVVATVHLVRHGETQGYSIDGGLTPMGRWQARRRGHDQSKSVRDGETVRLVCADTARAGETAEALRHGIEDGLSLWARDAKVIGPERREEFRNLQVWSPEGGRRDPTAAFREYHAVQERYERERIGDRPLWLVEMDRFWRTQDGGGDPISFWLTVPMLHFEPPALCVLRMWLGITRLIKESGDGVRIICATHSGPMRALATWAFGHDPGEPYNLEEVIVRVRRDLTEATVAYRNRSQEVHVPPTDRWPVWWEPDGGHAPREATTTQTASTNRHPRSG